MCQLALVDNYNDKWQSISCRVTRVVLIVVWGFWGLNRTCIISHSNRYWGLINYRWNIADSSINPRFEFYNGDVRIWCQTLWLIRKILYTFYIYIGVCYSYIYIIQWLNMISFLNQKYTFIYSSNGNQTFHNWFKITW